MHPPTHARLALALAFILALVSGCGDADDAAPATDTAPSDGGDAQDDAHDAVDPVDAPPDVAPTGCLGDADCGHIVGCCFSGACSNGTCVARSTPDCCAVEGPCATATPLHAATCVEPCAAFGCRKALRLPEAGCGDELWRLELTPEGVDALAVTDLRPDRVTWHLSERRGLEGGSSLYAGDVLCPTYHTGPLDSACRPVTPGADGAAVTLTLDTPPVTLPADTPSVAELWLWLDLEPSASGAPEGRFDGLDLLALDEVGVARPRWSSRQQPTPHRAWFPVVVDLSELAGRAARIRLLFDTLDGRDNDYEGVYVGALRLYSPCASDRDACGDAPCHLPRATQVAPIHDSLCVAAPAFEGRACEPCVDASTCATSDPCDVPTCTDGICELTRELTPDCCDPASSWPEPASFEASLGPDWSVTPAPAPAEPTWHRSDARARSGAWSLRFGDPDAPRIAPPGAAAGATIWSPPAVVPPDDATWRFALWLATEFDGAPDPVNPAGLDLLEALVEVVVDAPVSVPPAVVWDSRAIGGTTSGEWLEVALDLSAVAGRTVRLGWRFGTGDDAANDAEGVYLDDATLTRVCPGGDDPPPVDEVTP